MAKGLRDFASACSTGNADSGILKVGSRCIRCNMCTLASMDPKKFKAGCPFLKTDDGIGIEDIEELKLLVQPAL
jgi:hypothetical protein